MRGPIIGAAFLVGALSALAFGALPACVIQPPGTTVDAGDDVVVPPSGCDATGISCVQCQACGAAAVTCANFIQTCQATNCPALGECMDACDTDPDPSGCKEACCNGFAGDTDSINAYVLAAQCVYGTACPISCTFQRMYDVCVGFPTQ